MRLSIEVDSHDHNNCNKYDNQDNGICYKETIKFNGLLTIFV